MSKSIIDIRNLVYRSLRQKAIGRALAQLLVLGSAHTDSIKNLQTTYRTLLDYYVNGIDDPERNEVISYLIRETYELTDLICSAYIPTSYCEDETFRLFYTTLRYDSSTTSSFNELKTGDDWIRCCVASAAIMLSCINVFQEEKVLSLTELCSHPVRSVRLRAMTALIVVLIYHNERIAMYPQINNSLTLLFDDEDNVRLAQNVVKSLLRCTETERLTKDISENILPTLTKIAPDIKAMTENQEGKESTPEDNIYNIHDMLEDNGIADKMRSFAQLQQEGADINMSSFSQLKMFPFFYTMENWFMPFYKDNPAISELFSEDEKANSLIDTLLQAESMCDTDKYSLCLNIKSVSNSIRSTLLSNLKDESEATAIETEDPVKSDEKYINHYVQDIYRFFKLHKDRRYYNDIFAIRLEVHDMEFFRYINPGNTFLPEIAKFYQSKQLSNEALSAYLELLTSDSTNVSYYKAIGNCYIKLQDYTKALEYWGKADIIETGNETTIKKLAYSNRMCGNYAEAEKHYASLLLDDGDNLKYLYNISVCQIWQKKFKSALNNLYKLRFISDNVKESPEYCYHLGIALWSEGKKREAAEHLKAITPIQELEKRLQTAPIDLTQDEINFIIDYIRLNYV